MSTGRNTIYNVAGAVVSIAITVVTVPLYIHQIGDARYGVLAIVWMLLGYFGLFDMGLSRATAQAVAAHTGAGPEKQNDIIWAALLSNLGFGSIGAVALWLVARWALAGPIAMSGEWRSEVLNVLPWIAASVPIATTTSIFSGALQGRSRFLDLNVLSVVGLALFQIIPVSAAYVIGPNLNVVIPAAIAARVISSVPFALVCWRRVPLRGPRRACLAELPALLRFGVWVSGANIIGPLLASADRLVIGAIAGAQAVAYYVVPMSLADKLKIVPGSLGSALFPRFASAADGEEARREAEDVFVSSALLLAPLMCLAIALLPAFLTIWIGQAFSAKSALTGQIIVAGTWVNAAAMIPYIRIQAIGRPHLLVKYYLLELIPYLMCLWAGLWAFGVAGAALAWSLRTTADTVLLARGAGFRRGAVVTLLPNLALLCAATALGAVNVSPPLVIMSQPVILALSAWISWRQLSDRARRLVLSKLEMVRNLKLAHFRSV